MWPNSWVIYIMDHEIVPCTLKICDWVLILFQDHFGLLEEEKCKNDYKIWGSKCYVTTVND